MTKDGLPGEASQEGQSRPVSLAGLVLVLCVALMGVMGVSITLPILPKLGAVFHQDAAGVALLITCFTLPSAFMTPVAGVRRRQEWPRERVEFLQGVSRFFD